MATVSDYTALLNQDGSRWNAFTATGQPVVITYSFMDTLPSYSGYVGYSGLANLTELTPISENFRAATREIIQSFDSASGLDFVEVTDSDSVQLRLGAYDFSGTALSSTQGYAYYPEFAPSFTPLELAGDVYFNSANIGVNGSPQDYEKFIIAHEIGHALGLDHTFEGLNILTTLLDNQDNSLMSYTFGTGYWSSPRSLDIQALDYYYGTAASTEAAVAAYYTACADRVNISLAHITGDGQTVSGTHSSDLITGSTGNDVIAGMAGNDIIYGNAGTDQVRYYGSAGNYSITLENGLYTVSVTGNDTVSAADGRDYLLDVEQIAFLNFNTGTEDVRTLASIAVDQSQDNVVYRLYNHQTNGHFFTASAAERNQIVSELAHFTFEGTAFGATSTPTSKSGELEIYRFLNTTNGAHFFTASEAERDSLIHTSAVYAYEGVAYYGFEQGTANTQELYRFFNADTGIHFYTASAAERDSTIVNLPQFQYEGLAYNVDFIS
ncbi:matrixin family metalloprotease [Roseibium sp.]|uniref:matrixin family metalloprotease n=1 Tax=Roseibium sp. TaxID=1936156 RepID=UPI003B519CB8